MLLQRGRTMAKDITKDLQDLRYLQWSRVRKSSGTAGSFLKAYETRPDGRKIYYKLSNFDSVHGITGHECINEIIVCRLLDILGIEHLSYQLINARVHIGGKEYRTYLCASEDFKAYGDSKTALDDFYELEKTDAETPLEFCSRMGWQQYIYEMIIVDYLILNRDRHGANIEVLKSSRNGSIRLAPLFDHGMSLLCRCTSAAEAEKFDIMEDRPVQSFIGTHSAAENLDIIEPSSWPQLRELQERDRDILLKDLEGAIEPVFLEKIWEMIWGRWQVCESKRREKQKSEMVEHA